MRRKLACLLAWLPFVAVFLLMTAPPEKATAQSGWPPLDSNCSDGECVFGVSASADDAGPKPECTNFATTWPEIYFGKCTIGNSIVSGFHFPNIMLSRGTVITQAYLVFTVDGTYTTPITMTLYGEDSANAQPFSSSSQPANRPRLSGISTTWSIPSSDAWTAGSVRQSPNITAIIQAIINKSTWQSGNALAILTEPASSTASGAYRRVFAYDRAGVSYSARLVVRIQPHKAYLPAVMNNFPPPAATSYYVWNINTLGSLGRALGNSDTNMPGAQDNLVILHFGYPARQFVSQSTIWGAKPSFRPDIFIPTTAVITSSVTFATEYYNATVNDTLSRLRLVIAVSNCCAENDLAFFQNHGTAWAQAVNSIRSQIASCCSSRVTVVAGNDMEIEWNDPFATTEWLKMYATSSTCIPGAGDNGCFYNFGNNTVSPSGTMCATSRASAWTACDVWYISWGYKKNANDTYRYPRALPQIYHRYDPNRPQYPYGYDATQWRDLSIFSVTQMSASAVHFVGSLTQRARCGDSCTEGNNYPWEGYQLLYGALNSDARTKQGLHWSTDITAQP